MLISAITLSDAILWGAFVYILMGNHSKLKKRQSKRGTGERKMRAIDGDALKKIFENRLGLLMERYGVDSSEAGVLGGAIKLIDAQPTIRPERKKGEKIVMSNDRMRFWACNQCEEPLHPNDNFCPNCGADMRGGKNNALN